MDPTGRQRAALVFNRNKTSISIDLTKPEGVEIVKRIAERADVCIQNYRPGVADKLGVGYEEVRKVRPDIVYCEISAFGFVGPERHRVGFDIVAQAGGGAMIPNWHDPSLPAPMSVPIGDVTGMCLAALGVVSAVYHRMRTGEGQKVQTSMLDGVMMQSILRLISVEHSDREWRTATVDGIKAIVRGGGDFATVSTVGATGIGGLPTIAAQAGIIQNVYYRTYRTSDGFVTVGCLNFNQQRRLNETLALGDPRFVPGADLASPETDQAAADLEPKAEAAFLSKTTDEWIAELDAASIACSRVLSLLEVFDNPHHNLNQMVIRQQDPWLGELKAFGHPIKFSETPMTVRSATSPVGLDTDSVLSWLGYPAGQITEMAEKSVVYRSSVVTPTRETG